MTVAPIPGTWDLKCFMLAPQRVRCKGAGSDGSGGAVEGRVSGNRTFGRGWSRQDCTEDVPWGRPALGRDGVDSLRAFPSCSIG